MYASAVFLNKDNDVTFAMRVVLVGAGETYGNNECLTNDSGEPLIEFYDTRYQHTDIGQFVSRYLLSTFMAIADGRGLCLDGGNAQQWSISSSNVNTVKAILRKTFPGL